MPPGPPGIKLPDRHAVRGPSERPLALVRCRGDLDARTVGGHDHDHGIAPHPPHLVIRSGLPYLISRSVGFDQLVPEQERRHRPDQDIAYQRPNPGFHFRRSPGTSPSATRIAPLKAPGWRLTQARRVSRTPTRTTITIRSTPSTAKSAISMTRFFRRQATS